MKKVLLPVIALALTVIVSCSKKDETLLKLVSDIPTIQTFKSDAIPEADIEKIIQAGINSQSAMNKQPWHISVVTNKDVLNKISEGMKSGMPGGAGKPPADASSKPPAPADGENKTPPAPMGKKAGISDAPVAIIVSAKDGSELDAGLTTELMTVNAVLLGYGTKIISSPTIALNGPSKEEYKKLLGIPEDMQAKAILLIGKYDQKETDAISSATLRNEASEIVTIIK